jgi:hypothetical protein
VQGDDQNIIVLDIDEQTTTYVFAFQGHVGCIFEFKILATSRCSTHLKSAIEEQGWF